MILESFACAGCVAFLAKKWPFNQLASPPKNPMGDLQASGANRVAPQTPESLATTELVITSVSMVLTIVGGWFYFPLAVVGTAGGLYVFRNFLINTYQLWRKDQKLSVDILVVINTMLFLWFQYLFLFILSVFFVSLNKKLIARLRNQSKHELIDVFKSRVNRVWVVSGESEWEIPIDQLAHGDIVVVGSGEPIPVDGQVVQGKALVDQHILTGESLPAEKEVGAEVFALTLVLSGKIQIRVEKAGSETASAQIGEILEKTIDFKSDMHLHIEKLLDQSVMPTLVASTLSYPIFGLAATMSLLYANPKYKLLVPVSLSILTHVKQLAQQGVLVKDGHALEAIRQVDTLVFDKTGTLTLEQPRLGPIHPFGGHSEAQVLMYAGMAERKQAHPIAKAILREVHARSLDLPAIEDAHYQIGYGITAQWGEQTLRVGSARFIQSEHLDLPPELATLQETCQQIGASLILVALDQHVCGALELHPTIRPEARETMALLRQQGQVKEFYMISGDHEAPTKYLAEELGIDHYFAEVLPGSKGELIDQLQAQGKKACFIGDGINDAIALKKATVSISLKGASTVATDTAQIVLMEESLMGLYQVLDTAEKLETNLKTIYQSVTIPHAGAAVGALSLNLGMPGVMLLCQAGTLLGVGMALYPKKTHPQLTHET